MTREPINKLKPRAVWLGASTKKCFDYRTGDEVEYDTLVYNGYEKSFIILADGSRRPIQKPKPIAK